MKYQVIFLEYKITSLYGYNLKIMRSFMTRRIKIKMNLVSKRKSLTHNYNFDNNMCESEME